MRVVEGYVYKVGKQWEGRIVDVDVPGYVIGIPVKSTMKAVVQAGNEIVKDRKYGFTEWKKENPHV